MLRGLLKREVEIEPLDEPAARPRLVAPQSPNPSPKPSPKPRAKSFPLAHIYRAEPEPQAQAAALLSEIQLYAEDAVGKYVPQTELQRFYGELCAREGWQPKHWCVIGRELGGLTHKVLKKRGGKRFMAYKIPRVCA